MSHPYLDCSAAVSLTGEPGVTVARTCATVSLGVVSRHRAGDTEQNQGEELVILTKIKRPVRNKHVGFDAVICNGDYLMRASRTISFGASGLLAFLTTSSTSAAEHPGRNAWRQYASPEEAGFSSERLEEAYASAEEAG